MKRVGVTVHKLDLFSNGAIQNGYFMYKCLEASGLAVSYLAEEEPFDFCDKQVLKMDHTFPFDEFSHVITVTRIPSESFQERCKASGITLIKYICGNNFMFLMEDFALKNCTLSGSADEDSQIINLTNVKHVDEIWAFEGLREQKFMLETLTKLPVHIVPHLWNSDIVLKNGMPSAPLDQYRGGAFHILIAESNYSTCKCAFVPLVASEAVFVSKPELIRAVHILTPPKGKKPTQIMDSLQVSQLGKLYKYGRIPLPEALRGIPKHCPLIIVSHCTYNPLNYMHYELLEFGYALVHNSVILKDYGYYYPENDIGACTEQIFRAMHEHTNEKAQLMQIRFKNFGRSIDPNSENVQQEYKSMLNKSLRHIIDNPIDLQLAVMCFTKNEEGQQRKATMTCALKAIDFPQKFVEGHSVNSEAFQVFLGSSCKELYDKELRVLSHLFTFLDILTNFVYNSTQSHILILEDDAIICNNFKKRLVAAVNCFDALADQYCLRVGYLPGTDGNLPNNGLYVQTSEHDTVLYSIQNKIIGCQATVFSRKSAEMFLLDLTIFSRNDLKLDTLMVSVPKSFKPKQAYNLNDWTICAKSGVPPMDHLLDTIKTSVVIRPLVMENFRGQSIIGSSSSKERYTLAIKKGCFFLEDFSENFSLF